MTASFVAEIHYWDGAAEQIELVTTGEGFATRPGDTPPSKLAAPSLLDPGTYRRELFSGARALGPVRPSFGELRISNLDGRYDGWRNFAFDGRKLVVRYGEGAYPSDFATVFACAIDTITITAKEVRVKLRDRLEYLSRRKVLTQTFAGTEGVEGPPTMVGTIKPRCFGDPGFVPCIQVSAGSQIYFICADFPGGLQSFFQAWDGGMPLTRGADYSSAAECASTAPDPGYCRFWFDLVNGGAWVRCGTPVAVELRAYPLGYQKDGSAYTFGSLAREAGIDDAELGWGVVSQYVNDASMSILDLLQEQAYINFLAFGFDRNDAWQVIPVSAPAAPAAYTFTEWNTKGIEFGQSSDGAVADVSVNIGESWPCQLANGADAQMKDYLSRSPWWATYKLSNRSVLDAHPMAESATVEIKARAIVNSSGWNAWAEKYKELFMVEREKVAVRVPFSVDLLALDLHSAVEIKLLRFGLESGKLYRIVAVQYELSGNPTIQFTIWG